MRATSLTVTCPVRSFDNFCFVGFCLIEKAIKSGAIRVPPLYSYAVVNRLLCQYANRTLPVEFLICVNRIIYRTSYGAGINLSTLPQTLASTKRQASKWFNEISSEVRSYYKVDTVCDTVLIYAPYSLWDAYNLTLNTSKRCFSYDKDFFLDGETIEGDLRVPFLVSLIADHFESVNVSSNKMLYTRLFDHISCDSFYVNRDICTNEIDSARTVLRMDRIMLTKEIGADMVLCLLYFLPLDVVYTILKCINYTAVFMDENDFSLRQFEDYEILGSFMYDHARSRGLALFNKKKSFADLIAYAFGNSYISIYSRLIEDAPYYFEYSYRLPNFTVADCFHSVDWGVVKLRGGR